MKLLAPTRLGLFHLAIVILAGGACSVLSAERAVGQRSAQTNALHTHFAGEFEGQAAAPKEPLSLFYTRPATQWVEAVALGNGRIGAMVFGGIDRERIQLNEDTFWSGGPYNPARTNVASDLAEARQLVFAGNYRAADKLVNDKLMGIPDRQMSYQPVGDLMMEFPGGMKVKDYSRTLDLDTAIATTRFTRDGVEFTREAFVSAVAQVLVVRISANKTGQVSFATTLKTPQQGALNLDGTNVVVLRGSGPEQRGVPGAVKFECRAVVVPSGGSVIASNGVIVVSNADSALVLLDIGTNFKNYADVSGDPAAGPKAHLAAATSVPFDSLKEKHVMEHQRLFRRVTLNLGTNEPPQMPTNLRLKAFAAGTNDPQLAALYFQFGRYLLISSSRPGTQPANLQGIWNASTNPPWDSKFTDNINTEMNYWPAETCNLAECAQPLIQMVKEVSVTGGRTARQMFNARGWVVFHNTDHWRATAPVDGPWG